MNQSRFYDFILYYITSIMQVDITESEGEPPYGSKRSWT